MVMYLLNEAFSDQRWEIRNVIGYDHKVVLRRTHSAVHTGDSLGCRRPAGASPVGTCTSFGWPTARASSTGQSAMTPT